MQPVSRFCGCCGKGLAPLGSILQTAGSQGRHRREKSEQQGQIIPCPALLPVTWGHLRATQLFGWKSCLVPGRRAGAGGLQKAAQSRETQLSLGSRALYTLSSHFSCLLQVLYLYPRSSGICWDRGKMKLKKWYHDTCLWTTQRTASYWQLYL